VTSTAGDAEPGGGAWLPAWDGAAYAANTGHHRAFDEAFLDRLPLHRGDRVLDLGCGSGDFTATLAGLVPDGEVVGVDPHAGLLDEARARALPNQSFVEGPAQALAALLPADGAFDAVVSRAALHWIPLIDLPGVLAQCRRLLRPGGALRIEAGGGDNIARTVAVLDRCSEEVGGPTSPWTFLHAGTALELLEQAGFTVDPGEVRTVAQRRPFDRAGFTGWLHSQSINAYEHGMTGEVLVAFQRLVEESLDELRRHDGTWDQTFVRLDLVAHRPQ
jgi:trans-aconitate 2-methyltransferase